MAFMRALLMALGLFLAVAAVALTGRDSTSTAAPVASAAGTDERPDGVRRCRNRIEGPGKLEIETKRRDVRIGRVVWFGLKQPRRTINEVPGRDLSLKSAIAVRAGRPVLLRIPVEAREHISMNYAAERDGTHEDTPRVADGQFLVRVHPCPPDTPSFSNGGRTRVGRWTAFSGGFQFDERGCYPIETSRPNGTWARKRVSFGKRCD
jgi:hypothetical protein